MPPDPDDLTDDPDDLPDDIDAEFFAGVVASSPDPFVVLDGAGTIRWASRNGPALVGAARHEFVGHHITEFIAPDSLEPALAAFAQYTSPDRVDTGWIGPPMGVELVHRDGHMVPCEVRQVPTATPISGMVLVVSTSIATTALYDAIEQIVADAPLDTVMASIVRLVEAESPFSVPVIGVGWDGRRFASVVASAQAPQVGGSHLPAIADGRSPWQARLDTGRSIADDDLDAIDPELREAARTAGLQACWVLPIVADGTNAMVVWRRAPGPPLENVARRMDRIGAVVGLAIRSDASRRQLRRAARTDALTGLANRTALAEHLAEFERRPRHGLVAALYCDLDQFKAVNDDHGHQTGDRILAIVAERVRSRLRPGDLVARMGGDEFVVVTRGVDRSAIEALADRLTDALAAPITIGPISVSVGISVGVAAVADTDLGATVSGEELVERADTALLRAKQRGKRRIVWHD